MWRQSGSHARVTCLSCNLKSSEKIELFFPLTILKLIKIVILVFKKKLVKSTIIAASFTTAEKEKKKEIFVQIKAILICDKKNPKKGRVREPLEEKEETSVRDQGSTSDGSVKVLDSDFS